VFARSCVQQNGDGITQVNPPEIPNFSCPTLVRMPMGSDWQDLSNAASNFDNNKHGIKKIPEVPVPNHTVAYGADHTSIGEPGVDPFIKSANGSMTPGIAEPELSTGAKLIEIMKKYKQAKILAWRVGMNPDEAGEFVVDEMRKVLDEAREREAQDKMAEERMRAYFKAKLDRQKAEQKAQDERSLEAFKNYIKSKIAHSKMEGYKTDVELYMEEKTKALQKSKLAHELLKKMMSADCKNLKTAKQIQKELFEQGMIDAGDNMEDVRERGLSPSLSSGLQAPGTFTPVKGLFN